jgi:hypothetical protein
MKMKLKQLKKGTRRAISNRATMALMSLLVACGAMVTPAASDAAGHTSPTGDSPLLLLQGPGWRVQNTEENEGREGVSGSIEFVTGKPIPYETLKISGPAKHPHVSGLFPPATRQRRVELSWRPGDLEEAIAELEGQPHPRGREVLNLPVLGTTAYVDTRDEFYANVGGPGNEQMKALWAEGGDVYELRAAVPDLTAFEERLGWLTKVEPGAWLEAMPAKVVAPGDYDSTVKEVLKGIPTPKSFSLGRVPNEELVTDRYQVGARAISTVACLWFRQWGQAQRTGDAAAEAEAVKAMGTSTRWPILHEMTKEGAYSYGVWEDAKAMPQGYFEYDGHKRDLLAHAEGLGCANFGLPLKPEKMKIQRERGAPGPK